MSANNSEKIVMEPTNGFKGFRGRKDGDNVDGAEKTRGLQDGKRTADGRYKLMKDNGRKMEHVHASSHSEDSNTVSPGLVGKLSDAKRQGGGQVGTTVRPQDTQNHDQLRWFTTIRGPRANPQRFYDAFSN